MNRIMKCLCALILMMAICSALTGYAEEETDIENDQIPVVVSFDLTRWDEKLESLTCVVSSYHKPEDDTGTYWSKNGTWVIDFWDTQEEEPLSVCTICIDAHTGIPSALLLPSGTHYVGTPDNAEVVTGTEG